MKYVFLLVVFVATSFSAEIYMWTDPRGTAHYTNSIYEVPARFRDKVKVLTYGTEQKGDSGTPQQNNRPQPGEGPQPSPAVEHAAQPATQPSTPLNSGKARLQRMERRKNTSPPE